MLQIIVNAMAYCLLVSVAGIVFKKSLDILPSSILYAFTAIFGLIIWSIFAYVRGITLTGIVSLIPIALVSAIFSEAYPYYIYTKGEISLIRPIFSTYSAFTILFSWIFLGERLLTHQFILVLFIILGILIVNLEFKEIKTNGIKTSLWALSGAICVGISDTISKGGIDHFSINDFLFALSLVQIPVAFMFLLLERNKIKNKAFLKYKKDYALFCFAGIMFTVAQILFWLSFENTFASIASPLTSISPIFTIILARFLLKENLTLKKALGLFLVLVGTIGISI